MKKTKFNYLKFFNKTKRHLLKQNEKAMDSRYGCSYLTETGLRCAIGCHIPKANYHKDLENLNVEHLDVLKALPYTHISKQAKRFMDDLQQIHDECRPDEWKNQFKLLKEEWSKQLK